MGEDYSTLESIRRTGGLVPDSTWEQNWRNIQANVTLAEKLGMKLLTFHAGFLPHDESDPGFKKLIERIGRVADLFAAKSIQLGFETGQETATCLQTFLEKLGMKLVTFHAGFLPHDESDLGFRKLIERIGRVADLFAAKSIQLGFETGQETATCLQMFLDKLDRPTVGVNFDPANLILYDKGDPIDALRILGPWLKQCHIKDATRTRQPGTWGEEVVVGTGEVNWPAFFQTLNDLKFTGYLSIEREAGTQRVQDIQAARQYLDSVLDITEKS